MLPLILICHLVPRQRWQQCTIWQCVWMWRIPKQWCWSPHGPHVTKPYQDKREFATHLVHIPVLILLNCIIMILKRKLYCYVLISWMKGMFSNSMYLVLKSERWKLTRVRIYGRTRANPSLYFLDKFKIKGTPTRACSHAHVCFWCLRLGTWPVLYWWLDTYEDTSTVIYLHQHPAQGGLARRPACTSSPLPAQPPSSARL